MSRGEEMYSFYNPNPYGHFVGDCAVRAISAAINQSWEQTYIDLCIQGYISGDLPNSNAVWDIYLKHHGFKRYTLPDTCPECYKVADFCYDYPQGTYILGTGTHVVTIIDGCYLDAWDSGHEKPIYFYKKGD